MFNIQAHSHMKYILMDMINIYVLSYFYIYPNYMLIHIVLMILNRNMDKYSLYSIVGLVNKRKKQVMLDIYQRMFE
jgi:hypothetical protein